ncbi:MAG TPA: hypothetical protein VHB98_05655, partial [Chloroflexota bacterium]|nr:hypothetical protein [Chloroflexota bacterium]
MFLLLAVLGAILALHGGTAQAAATVIGSGTVASCQTAAAATALTNALSAGGQITFSCGGGPATLPVSNGTLIAGNSATPTTIDGTGQQVTIQGTGSGSLLTVNSSVTLTLIGLTLTGGSAAAGGGIDNNGGPVTLSNSTLSGNSAGTGGGIFNHAGTVTLTNSTLSGNTATSGAG